MSEDQRNPKIFPSWRPSAALRRELSAALPEREPWHDMAPSTALRVIWDAVVDRGAPVAVEPCFTSLRSLHHLVSAFVGDAGVVALDRLFEEGQEVTGRVQLSIASTSRRDLGSTLMATGAAIWFGASWTELALGQGVRYDWTPPGLPGDIGCWRRGIDSGWPTRHWPVAEVRLRAMRAVLEAVTAMARGSDQRLHRAIYDLEVKVAVTRRNVELIDTLTAALAAARDVNRTTMARGDDTMLWMTGHPPYQTSPPPAYSYYVPRDAASGPPFLGPSVTHHNPSGWPAPEDVRHFDESVSMPALLELMRTVLAHQRLESPGDGDPLTAIRRLLLPPAR